jgi:hypothetical protein
MIEFKITKGDSFIDALTTKLVQKLLVKKLNGFGKTKIRINDMSIIDNTDDTLTISLSGAVNISKKDLLELIARG